MQRLPLRDRRGVEGSVVRACAAAQLEAIQPAVVCVNVHGRLELVAWGQLAHASRAKGVAAHAREDGPLVGLVPVGRRHLGPPLGSVAAHDAFLRGGLFQAAVIANEAHLAPRRLVRLLRLVVGTWARVSGASYELPHAEFPGACATGVAGTSGLLVCRLRPEDSFEKMAMRVRAGHLTDKERGVQPRHDVRRALLGVIARGALPRGCRALLGEIDKGRDPGCGINTIIGSPCEIPYH